MDFTHISSILSNGTINKSYFCSKVNIDTSELLDDIAINTIKRTRKE